MSKNQLMSFERSATNSVLGQVGPAGEKGSKGDLGPIGEWKIFLSDFTRFYRI